MPTFSQCRIRDGGESIRYCRCRKILLGEWPVQFLRLGMVIGSVLNPCRCLICKFYCFFNGNKKFVFGHCVLLVHKSTRVATCRLGVNRFQRVKVTILKENKTMGGELIPSRKQACTVRLCWLMHTVDMNCMYCTENIRHYCIVRRLQLSKIYEGSELNLVQGNGRLGAATYTS